jgi:phosphoglycolate phosphatase
MSSDVLMGRNCGLQTLLVGTGVDGLEEVNNCEGSMNSDDAKLVPDFYAESLGKLHEMLTKKGLIGV